MDIEGFKITQLSFYNYGQKELSGSIHLSHGVSQNKIELRLTPADCSKIINIIADRVAETIHEAARQFWVDVGMPMREFMPSEEPKNAALGGAAGDEAVTVLNPGDPGFEGQKED